MFVKMSVVVLMFHVHVDDHVYMAMKHMANQANQHHIRGWILQCWQRSPRHGLELRHSAPRGLASVDPLAGN